MTDEEKRMLDHHLSDAIERIKSQNEFSQSAFRALLLINGGAIVAMLTYAGNVLKPDGVANLTLAFVGYASGLLCTVIAMIAAYFSQGAAFDHAWTESQRLLGKPVPESKGSAVNLANRIIAVGLVIGALAGFVLGSAAALDALTH